MSLPLPPPLDGYFQAVNAHDAGRIAACFATDAVVHDERRDLIGREAIRAWAEETSRLYRHTAEPLSVEAVADRTDAMARVTGEFPGSPIELRYLFTLTDGLIRRLEIRLRHEGLAGKRALVTGGTRRIDEVAVVRLRRVGAWSSLADDPPPAPWADDALFVAADQTAAGAATPATRALAASITARTT